MGESGQKIFFKRFFISLKKETAFSKNFIFFKIKIIRQTTTIPTRGYRKHKAIANITTVAIAITAVARGLFFINMVVNMVPPSKLELHFLQKKFRGILDL